MFIAVCQFSLGSLSQSRLIQRIKDKVFAKFKLSLVEVGDEGEALLAVALIGKDENYLRSICAKLVSFIEESEGLRVEDEQLELIQK